MSTGFAESHVEECVIEACLRVRPEVSVRDELGELPADGSACGERKYREREEGELVARIDGVRWESFEGCEEEVGNGDAAEEVHGDVEGREVRICVKDA